MLETQILTLLKPLVSSKTLSEVANLIDEYRYEFGYTAGEHFNEGMLTLLTLIAKEITKED